MELGRHVLNSDYTLKNFALWSHKCPHVQSLCVCIYTCKHKLTWRVNIVGSLLYRLQQRYLFKIALWHTAVYICVYVYTHTHTYIYICALQKLGLIQDKENWCEWKIFTLKDHFEWHSVILQKQGLGFFSSCLYSSLSIFFISFSQNP